MINCNNTNKRLFIQSQNESPILDDIQDIRVTIVGSSGTIPSHREISVVLKGVSNDSTNKPKFSFIVSAPIVGIFDIKMDVDSSGRAVVYPYPESAEHVCVSIDVEHTINSIDKTIDLNAKLCLNRIYVRLIRLFNIAKAGTSRTINMSNGINSSVSYTNGSIVITGGSGLGLGTYDGMIDKNTSKMYTGIRSINGLRASRNVDIKFSDLLLDHKASVK